MSNFDEQAFRQAAKAAGHSDEDINATVLEETKNNQSNTDSFTKGSSGYELGTQQQATEKLGNDWWHLPAAMAVGSGLGLAAKSLYDRKQAAATLDSAVGRIEPTTEAPLNTIPTTPIEKAAVMADPMAEAKLREANAKADFAEHRLKMAQKPSGVVPAPVAPSMAAPVATPEVPAGTVAQTKAATVPVTPIANAADPAALAQTVEKQADVAENLAPKPVEAVKKEPKIKGAVAPEMPQETLKTASGFNAFVGQGESKKRVPTSFESVKDVPKDYAFIPGMDIGGTNYARQTLGQTGAIESARTIGQPFGPYTETQKVLKGLDQERVGPPATRDLRKSIGAPMPPNTTGLAGKAVKVGGVAGTLLLLSDLASAGQDVAKGDFSKAGGKAAEAISSFFPGFQGATFSKGAGEGEQEQIDYLRRIEEAKRKGAGNRGAAYDPRKFYTPMDGSVPPPLR